jgi:CMP-N-acetylneuraminic acid synthetase
MNKPAITALITIQEIHNSINSILTDAHVKDFGGKPLFQLMIDKLLSVNAIDKIVVTTDSDKVKKIYGNNSKISIISLPDPATLSSENSAERILEDMPTSDWFTANALKKTTGEHFMQTQCINPLLSLQTIEDAIERYYYVLNDEYKQFDSVMSLYRVEKRLYDNSNYPNPVTLRNDPHFVIFEDNVFHIFNRSAFTKNNHQKLGKNPMFFEVPEIESLTVESPVSYQLARLAFENKQLFS